MGVRARKLALLAVVAATTSCEKCCFDCPVPADAPVLAAVEQASLIFEGTALRSDAIKVDEGPGSERAMVVQVGQLLRVPEEMKDLEGDTVAIVPRTPMRLAAGAHAVFFGHVRFAGARLVVEEVKRIPVASQKDVDSVTASIVAAEGTLADSAILANAQSADAVVLVRIQSVSDVQVPDSIAAMGSEHAPEWKLATGEVLTSFRKADSALLHRPVSVLFAAGEPSFADSTAQLEAGEARILWLHRLSRLPETLRPGIDPTNKYFVLETDDARATTDSGRVARVLVAKYGAPLGGPPTCRPMRSRKHVSAKVLPSGEASKSARAPRANPNDCGLAPTPSNKLP